MDKKTYTFHVHGMHCKSCVLLTETELAEVSHVQSVHANLANHTVTVSGDFGEMNIDDIAQEFSDRLEKHGYSVSAQGEYKKKQKNWSEFKIAVPVAIAFAVLFLLLQKMGIVNLVQATDVSYGTAFVVGIIASLSTCMAVVGGLVLSMSATFAKEGDRIRPQLLFQTGRLVSFFVLGGVIGAIGSAFALNTFATFILSLAIGLVMLLMGLNLLDVFHWAKKFQPGMPKLISKRAFNVSKLNHTLTPVLVGIATFFLPCGFTQSMQIYTLSTGTFISGALTMFFYALGTLPVLLLIGFSSFSIQKTSKAGIFFKSAGLIVMLFALFNLINSLVVIGVLPPLFNF
jgi:uncharacterized protein